MEYLQNPTVQALIVAAFALWLMFSPDVLADTLRVWIFKAKSVAIRVLDSAVARNEKAAADAELAKSRAETSLLTMKTARNELALQLKPFDEKIAAMDRAATKAGLAKDQPSVDEAVKAMQDALNDSASIRTLYKKAVTRVEELALEIDGLDTEIRIRRANVADAKSRSANATSRKEIFAIVAGLDSAGSQANKRRAEEILVHAEAEAMTFQEEATKAVNRRREEAKLAALGSEEPSVSTEELVAKYMNQASK